MVVSLYPINAVMRELACKVVVQLLLLKLIHHVVLARPLWWSIKTFSVRKPEEEHVQIIDRTDHQVLALLC